MDSNNKEKDDIKYCVTAFIDLLGFSNHLEVGNDLRTTIGQESIKRLEFIEESIDLFENEKLAHKEYYPDNIAFQRINDSLILTIDLPKLLTPGIGESMKTTLTFNEMEELFPYNISEDNETLEKSFREKLTSSILELSQFIGLVTRIHSFINDKENQNYYPGCKTVIASGYRKRFISKSKGEDFFSANFSFSNAYIAETQLKGAGLYIDNYVLQMLGLDKFTNNIVKIASFISANLDFDPFENDHNSLLGRSDKYRKCETFKISLFRKNYLFREMNSNPLSYLQLFPVFLPFLNGEKKLPKSKDKNLFFHIFENFRADIKNEDTIEIPNKFTFNVFDIKTNINDIKQYILKGSLQSD